MLSASAPGKAILSGEYSVLFGVPALAIALDLRLSVKYQPDLLPRLSWLAPDRVHELALEKFASLRHRLDNAFEGYLKGERSISEILSRPAELVFYTVDIARLLGNLKSIPRGKVDIHSDIPIGAGMGSSAALLAALLMLFSNRREPADLIRQVRHCERLQHGRGSLIDAATVCLGGLVRVENDQALKTSYSLDLFNHDWYWIHTGTPAMSTGVCVDQVRRRFTGAPIWAEFAEVSAGFETALADGKDVDDLVRLNQRLLNRIGVVPAKVAALIEQIEEQGGAAKVSGAGAVAGDHAGLVLAHLPGAKPADFDLPPEYRWGVLRASDLGVALDD